MTFDDTVDAVEDSALYEHPDQMSATLITRLRQALEKIEQRRAAWLLSSQQPS